MALPKTAINSKNRLNKRIKTFLMNWDNIGAFKKPFSLASFFMQPSVILCQSEFLKYICYLYYKIKYFPCNIESINAKLSSV